MLSQGAHSSTAKQMDGHSAARLVNGGYSVGVMQPGYIAAAPGRNGYPRGDPSATLAADAAGPFFYVRGAGQSGEQYE